MPGDGKAYQPLPPCTTTGGRVGHTHNLLLLTATEFIATQAQDKVIGILGLLGDGLTMQRTSMLVQCKTVDEVYHATAVHLVDLGAAHVMIRCSGLNRRKSTHQIPSWVPDWSAQTNEFITPARIRRCDALFCAASHLKSKLYLEGHEAQHGLRKPLPAKLVVSGAVIDTIKFVSGIRDLQTVLASRAAAAVKSTSEENSASVIPDPKYDNTYIAFRNWHISARECLEHASASIASSLYDDNEDAFARTLIYNYLHPESLGPGIFSPITDVVQSYEELMVTLRANPTFHFSLSKYNAMETYFMQVLTCYQKHIFAVTEKGYMAMVPEIAHTGDTVSLFCGSPTLAILTDVTTVESGSRRS